ncbi:MAG: DUF1080 domain-containing protein [Acidobacteria bacterium]|nr:DUF1080 domain-containing protein [Acidobacteriota bacterium]
MRRISLPFSIPQFLNFSISLLLCHAALAAADKPNTLTRQDKKEGYILLFNGKDLTGWEGEPALWSVKDGVLVGSTEGHPLQHNTFLITKDSYSDFVLKLEIKLRNHNSGIQFRSKRAPEYVVSGYQADAAEGNWWGSLYEERGRGVLVNGWKGKGEKVVKASDWNQYEITARGNHIQLKLNGLVTAELDDDKARDGIIALQLHQGPPMQVEFRNMKLKKF